MRPWAETRHKYRDPRAAGEYDRRRYQSPHRRLRELMNHATLARALSEVPPRARLLDLPCGTGRLLPWLEGRGFAVTGADIALPMLARAAGRTRAPLLVADAEALPFAADSWDVVLAARFVHLVPPEVRVRVFRELARVSRGWVLLTVPIEGGTLKGAWRALRGTARPGRLSLETLRAELESAGLRLTRAVKKLPVFSTFQVLVCRVAER